ncbi:MAG: hypothetical protein AAFO07_26140, partial [Bacteroidota bacterium]
MKKQYFLFALLFLAAHSLVAQSNEELMKEIESLRNQVSSLSFSLSSISKSIDDVQFYNKLGDVAFIDKVELTGPPLGKDMREKMTGKSNPSYYTNPLRFKTYIFIPKSVDGNKKYPLIVLPHHEAI